MMISKCVLKCSNSPTEIIIHSKSVTKIGEYYFIGKYSYLGFRFTKPVKKDGTKTNYFLALEKIANNPGIRRNEIREAANYPYNHGWDSFFNSIKAIGLAISKNGCYYLTYNGYRYISAVHHGYTSWQLL